MLDWICNNRIWCEIVLSCPFSFFNFINLGHFQNEFSKTKNKKEDEFFKKLVKSQ